MRLKLEKICPRHAWLPIASAILFNLVIYFCSKLVPHSRYFDLTTAIDLKIPFIMGFIYIYIFAFVQWAVSYIILGRGEKKTCYTLCAADIIAKTICFLFFLFMPTLIAARPQITGGGFTAFVTKVVFAVDTPAQNLFPSIHCLESYMAIRVAFSSKKVPVWFKVFTLVFSLAVFVSVLFVKQHFFIDIPAGILVGEIGIIIAKLTKADRVFYKLCKVEEKEK